ncbi:MAG: hypothetical protein ABF760_07900 [Zymomonas mobilis]|uniref:hypothetical protein n=1 Tax=Zymomonas mobilis TaxID=542 RepID=UPI001154B062|nr:hypothetical protein [Zymomonas mobilis]
MFRLSANIAICLAAVLLSSLTAVALCLLLVISTSGKATVRKKPPILATVITTSLPTEGTAQREQKFLECRYLAPKSSKDEKMKLIYRECLRRIAFDGDLPPEHRR